jgi:type I restriction enzyme S subunit
MREDWKRYKIGDLAHGIYDGPHATPTPTDAGPIFIGIKNITKDGRIDLSGIRHISESVLANFLRRSGTSMAGP